MTELAGVAVIILMGIAGILSMFQDPVPDETTVTQPESGMRRHAA